MSKTAQKIKKLAETIVHRFFVSDGAGNEVSDPDMIVGNINHANERAFLHHASDSFAIHSLFDKDTAVSFADLTAAVLGPQKQTRKNKPPAKHIVLDRDADTLTSRWIATVEHTTPDMVRAFGEPDPTGGPDDKWKLEWKFTFGDHAFSIYDWSTSDVGSWHVAANTDSKLIASQFFKQLKERVVEAAAAAGDTLASVETGDAGDIRAASDVDVGTDAAGNIDIEIELDDSDYE